MPAKPNESVTAVDAHVGRMIRAIRKAKGVTQEVMADALGVTFQQIQKYELGVNRISASKMFAAAKTLDVSPGAFFEGIEGASTASAPPVISRFFELDGASKLAKAFVDLPPDKRRLVTALIVDMVG